MRLVIAVPANQDTVTRVFENVCAFQQLNMRIAKKDVNASLVIGLIAPH